MTDVTIAVAAFVCIAGSAWAGGKVREITPVEHLSPDTREIVIAGLGLVSTLAAVVLGLLIDSYKDSFDAIFAGFGPIAPANRTVRRVLLLCAVSVSLSIDLILELDDPLTGALSVSSAPLVAALAQIGV